MAWWRWDLLTNRVQMDDRKATMLGYTPEEFPTDVYEICKLIHPDDYDVTMQKMKDHLTGLDASWDCTYRIRRKDGSYAWYYDHGKITERLDGRPVTLTGTVIDVSILKEQEIRMIEKQSIFDQMFSGNSNARLLANRFGRVLFSNDAGLSIASDGKEDVARIDNFAVVVSATGEVYLPFSDVAMKKTAVAGLPCRIQGDTSGKEFLLFVVPLFDGNREFDGVFIVLN